MIVRTATIVTIKIAMVVWAIRVLMFVVLMHFISRMLPKMMNITIMVIMTMMAIMNMSLHGIALSE